ncbi:MlaD family protein [Gordonia rhizosphera]|uniref:Mce family protein n=1 Tax=Gordonia rhizosphera NBRC 16068 TaxID=1108045 RepID=K6VSM4_9ACTN|nr:MCE family protein [Gordonia rhizosphera]GAB89885.1 Mce family protein [Gordonia rhizosphera NBRC 16068]
MNIDTGGRNPSLRQYVFRGVSFAIALVILFVILFLRYDGAFSSSVPVTAKLTDVGDGLLDGADVRYNGMIVGSVQSITVTDETGPGNVAFKDVAIDVDPDQAPGIPANVTARTVPANLFGVNTVELVQPAKPADQSLASGATIPADTSLPTLRLQDAQNELSTLLDAVPPEDLAAVLGTLADALKGGGAVFGAFVPLLDNYWKTLNAQFPPGAPSGFDNFDNAIRGLAQSTPQLLDALGRSVIPAMTIAEKQDDLTALLSAGQGLLDASQALFAANGDRGKYLIGDLNTMVGAAVLEPNSLPEAVTALNNLAAKVLTVFTGVNGHAQLNIGVGFGSFMRYTRQNCPVYNGGPYGQLRGPGCVGPGTGTGPTSSGPLMIYPSDGMRRNAAAFGAVTTSSDNETLGTALKRKPNAADTLMLGPLVQSSTITPDTGLSGGGR